MHALRLTSLLLTPLALALGALPAIATDLLPAQHSLRYAGTDDGRPVTVEITLREYLGIDTGAGMRTAPPDLAAGTLDALSVRLRARADIARGLRRADYPVWNDEVRETWVLEVSGAEKIPTPDANYESLKFRLGSEREWIEGWSAPLLLFHFVRIDEWRDGRRIGTLPLETKQF